MRRNNVFVFLQRHNEKVGLIFILLLSIILRVYGLSFPLYHWDEKLDFGNTIYASFNHLRLLFYNHGSFLNYLELALWSVFLLGQGVFPSPQSLLLSFLTSPKSLAVVGRFFILLGSVLTVWGAYFVAKKFFDKKVGLIAALCLAFNFLHVSQSHYARGHIPSVLFVLFAAFFSWQMITKGRRIDYVLAGGSIGLAASFHIPLVILMFPFVVFHMFRMVLLDGGRSWGKWLLFRPFLFGLFSALFAFLLTTPYALLDMPTFIAQLKYFIVEAADQVWVSSEGQPILLFYFTEHLKNGMGLSFEIFALAGLGYGFFRRSKPDIVILTFIAFLLIVVSGKANFARYALVLLPFLAILAARLLVQVASFVPNGWQGVFTGGMILFMFFPSFMNITRYDYWITQPDTREQATTWILENIPTGAKVISEGADVLSPNLPLSVDYIEKILTDMDEGSYGQFYYQTLLEVASPDVGYEFIKVFKLDENHRGTSVGVVDSASLYKKNDVEYLVTVSWMQRSEIDEYSPEFQASLDALYKEIAVFEPTIDFRWDPYAWRMDYEALSQVRVGEPIVGGPRLVVYQLRNNEE